MNAGVDAVEEIFESADLNSLEKFRSRFRCYEPGNKQTWQSHKVLGFDKFDKKGLTIAVSPVEIAQGLQAAILSEET